jgi:hypothetical protein
MLLLLDCGTTQRLSLLPHGKTIPRLLCLFAANESRGRLATPHHFAPGSQTMESRFAGVLLHVAT